MTTILESIEELFAQALDALPAILGGLAIFLLAWVLSKWVPRAVRKSMEKANRDPELIVLFRILSRWGILVLGLVLALNVIAPGRFSTLVAGLGVAGFTIGFALQDVAKNFVSGILLLMQQPFEIGDSIQVAGFQGKVQAITLRTTEICALDGRLVIIPNGDVFISPIVNFSRAPRRRLEVKVGVAGESHLDQVARTALEAIAGVTGVLEDPSPKVIFDEFGESAIEFTLYYWIDTNDTDVLEARDAGIRGIKTAFERDGIEMPFPTVTVLTPQR